MARVDERFGGIPWHWQADDIRYESQTLSASLAAIYTVSKMGRSAKFLKKVKKTVSSTSQFNNRQAAANAPQLPEEQKKKAGLKAKAHRRKPGSEGHVLGGADYVELMMGGRRKAREEAAKLPQEES
ncbi:hypothetical protein NM688_g2887 [Phlebia brevispora]|uniref:Uncharacterized protein n=1 Tax=Phlebia brevispora TaxID=194682 RepID=A0ACC1T7J1_9APHY|nr:hypothetical protein NM688_g2887 [Phlebia brevispora]